MGAPGLALTREKIMELDWHAGRSELDGLALLDRAADESEVDLVALRAYRLARRADTPEADAVFISGTGLPTLSVLSMLEDDLGKPVISSATAMMWNALRLAGVGQTIEGYGRLLSMS